MRRYSLTGPGAACGCSERSAASSAGLKPGCSAPRQFSHVWPLGRSTANASSSSEPSSRPASAPHSAQRKGSHPETSFAPRVPLGSAASAFASCGGTRAR